MRALEEISQDLVKNRLELEALAMVNSYNQPVDFLVSVEKQRILAERKKRELNIERQKYIDGEATK